MRARPTGITASALLLAWLALGGVGNALLRLPSGLVHHQVTAALAFVYAASAGVACVGLWRMRFVGIRAFRGWAVVCLLLLVWSPIGLGLQLPGRVALNVAVLALLVAWHQYLVRVVRSAA